MGRSGLKFSEINQTYRFTVNSFEVYKSYIDARIHQAFTGAEAFCDAKPGGKFSAWDGYITGKILELKPGEKIVQEWITSEWPEGYPPSVLELLFIPDEKGTLLKLRQTGVPADQADSYREGWIEHYFKPMEAWFKRNT